MRTFLEDFPTAEERAIVKIACENSLKAFIKVIHYYNNGSKFTFKPFHDEVIKALEDRVLNGNPKNLILNLPVGFGKSQIVEYFISWTFAKNPDICHLYTSYSDKLIQKLSSEVIDIIKSEPFETLWNYDLRKDKKSRANWSIEGSVGRAGLTAGSIGGTITGLDAGNPAVEGFCGALIVDDPMKAGDEIYETKRDLVTEFFDRKLKTRLRRSDVPIILIMQRLHEEDLTGYIKFEGKFGNGMSADEKKKWKENWDCISPIFKFSMSVRKVIYTTNTIESLNSVYRKLNSQRSVFPSDTALLKALYLATFEATKKWTGTIRNWAQVYGELSIMYEGRLPE